MKLRWIAALLLLASPVAAAEEPYGHDYHVRLLTGLGGTPETGFPTFVVTTAELGHRPFEGALSTGIAFSSALELNGLWSIITPWLFSRIDLTYAVASKMWERQPAYVWWPRVMLGFRAGLDVSESFRTKVSTGEKSYVLARPVAQPSLEVEVPCKWIPFAVNGRAALDVTPGFELVFRYTLSLGITYGWD